MTERSSSAAREREREREMMHDDGVCVVSIKGSGKNTVRMGDSE